METPRLIFIATGLTCGLLFAWYKSVKAFPEHGKKFNAKRVIQILGVVPFWYWWIFLIFAAPWHILTGGLVVSDVEREHLSPIVLIAYYAVKFTRKFGSWAVEKVGELRERPLTIAEKLSVGGVVAFATGVALVSIPGGYFGGMGIFFFLVMIYCFNSAARSTGGNEPLKNTDDRAGIFQKLELLAPWGSGRDVQCSIAKRQGVFIGYADFTAFLDEKKKKIKNAKPCSPDIPLMYRGEGHILTIGRPGSGKNATVQTPALLHYKGSALVIDVKGQLCCITARRRMEMGQEVFAINPFDELGIPTATYNPLTHLNPESYSFATDCGLIAEGIIGVKKADFWEMSAVGLVTLLIMWVKLYEEEKNLLRVRQLLFLPKEKTDPADSSAKIHPRREQLEMMLNCDDEIISEGVTRFMTERGEVEDVFSTAQTEFAIFRDKGIARILEGGSSDISFVDLKRKKQTVYLIIPFTHLSHHGKFLRLLVLCALGELMREKTIPEDRVLFMLDEFRQLGKMPTIIEGANIVRDSRITLWPVLQSWPQLTGLYGREEAEMFYSTAGVTQVFATNDTETERYFSARSGLDKARKVNYSDTTNSGSEGKASSSSTENISYVDEPRFSPGFMRQMGNHAQILFGPAEKATAGWRYPYWELKDMFYTDGAPLFDQDFYHMKPEEQAEFERKARAGEWVIRPKILNAPQPSYTFAGMNT